MDNFPTALASLGVEIKGDRLGLGTNLYSDTQTLTEELGCEELAASMGLRSEFLAKLEKTDALSENDCRGRLAGTMV
jgi:phosphoglycerol transferase